jgi:predicted enzyme related to lactoylglutathione lyase
MEGGESYSMIVLGDGPVGGILDLAARGVPESIPAHWQVYFGVEDTDATIDAAKAAGGGVMLEPVDIPFGRFAILTDPHGASFAVIALSEMARDNDA